MLPMIYSTVTLIACVLVGTAALGHWLWRSDRSWLHSALLAAIVGLLVFSWLAVVLGTLGWFRWPYLLGGLALLAFLLNRFFCASVPDRPRSGSPAKVTLQDSLLLLLMLGTTWLYSQPAESYLVVEDAAVYSLAGEVLAKNGEFMPRANPFWDSWLVESSDANIYSSAAIQQEQFDSPAKALFREFGDLGATSLPSQHYGPFYRWLLLNPRIEIGYMPLPKIWMGLASLVLGAGHAAWATPVFGTLAILLLYVILEKPLGPWFALGGAGALAICLPQVWFSRLSLSEVYAQVLILGGLALHAAASDDQHENGSSSLPFHIMAGVSLATLGLVRFEGLVLGIAFWTVLLFFSHQDQRRFLTWPTIAFAGASVVSFAIAIGLDRMYLLSASLFVLGLGTVRAGLLAASGLALVTLLIGGMRRDRNTLIAKAMRIVSRLDSAVMVLPWLLWAIQALIALSTRPLSESLAGWLVQYLGIPLLIAALGGVLCSARVQQQAATKALFLVSGVFLLIYTVNPFVTPTHPWGARRLVPIVLPALAASAATMAHQLWHIMPRSASTRPWRILWPTRGLAIGSLLLIIVLPAQVSWPLLTFRENAGFWEGLSAWAATLEENAVIFVEKGPVGKGLTQPLEFIFDRAAISLPASNITRTEPLIDGILEKALADGRPTYLLVSDGALDWHPDRWRFEPAGSTTIVAPYLAQPWGRPPTADDISERRLFLDLYRTVPVSPISEATATQGLDIDLGSGTYPYLREGFFGVEGSDDQTFRWTAEAAELVLPWPALDSPATFCLRLRLAGGRPPDEPPAQLAVIAEGQRVYEVTLGYDYAPVVLDIPIAGLRDSNEPGLELELRVNPWSPADHGSADTRALGVALYGLTVASDCGALAP